jgi:hypothetical protein
MRRATMQRNSLAGLLILFLTSGLQAQFHAKNATGQTGVNQTAVNAAQTQGSAAMSAAPGNSPFLGGGLGGGDMILPDGTKQALSQYHVKLGQMKGKPVDIWGRAIHHSDGSFTESKQDMETNTLTQETKSKNGVRLQTRRVMLDELGRPGEVLIYDGRDQFKYRGMQVYDTFGRFSEEQLYDAKGTLIRRKVQEYNPRGEKLPLRSWDYVANVPDDLKLVITREDAAPAGGATDAATSSPGNSSSGAAPAVPEKKGGWRLFGGKKNN